MSERNVERSATACAHKRITGIKGIASIIMSAACVCIAPATVNAFQLPPDVPPPPRDPLPPGSPGIPEIPGGQPATNETAETLARMRVIRDVSTITAGETFHVIVHFRVKEHWHLYWKNPGAGAAAPRIAVRAPQGFEVGEVRWPRPVVIKTDTGDMYAYEGEVALFVPITAPIELPKGGVSFQVTASWAVCDEVRCLMGRRTDSIMIPTTAGPTPTVNPDASLVEEHARRLPMRIEDHEEFSVSRSNDIITITGPSDELSRAILFPNPSPGVTMTQKSATFSGGRITVEILVEQEPENYLGEKPVAGGLIALGTKPDDPAYEFSVPLE